MLRGHRSPTICLALHCQPLPAPPTLVTLPVAVRAIAKMAIERKCGARGLRAIIESVMLDTMFELPGLHEVNACTITAAAVEGKEKPQLSNGLRKKNSRSRRTERDSEGNYMIGSEPVVS